MRKKAAIIFSFTIHISFQAPVNQSPIIKEVPPKALLMELDVLKKENAAIYNEKEHFRAEYEVLKSENINITNQFSALEQELTDVKGQLYQAQQELSEAESVVQECVEEKKKLAGGINSNGKCFLHFYFLKLLYTKVGFSKDR